MGTRMIKYYKFTKWHIPKTCLIEYDLQRLIETTKLVNPDDIVDTLD